MEQETPGGGRTTSSTQILQSGQLPSRTRTYIQVEGDPEFHYPTRQVASFVVHYQATPEEQAEIREARAASSAKRAASAAQAKAAKRHRLEREVRRDCGEGAEDEDFIPGDE